jgi:beta-carotene 3-hydroxylase
MKTVLVLVAFVLMEGVAYLTHRFVMHGRLGAWHRSHHQVRSATFEGNDLYPLVGAAGTITLMAIASMTDRSALLAVGAGITAYGAAYLFVHDVYIHRRLSWFRWTFGPLEHVREAHRIHHLWADEPYGFLFPIVPAELRTRVADVSRDPLRPPPPPEPPSATSAPSPAG